MQKITTIGKISKQTATKLLKQIDMRSLLNEEEQTVLTSKSIYEFNYCQEDNEITIRKYTHSQYATAYGERTLEDLKESRF